MMREIGEQWIEVIDGQEHMLKVVEKVSEKSYDCTGCIFNGHNGTCRYHSQNCPSGEVEHGYIKDLGILNEDGCLPCPFCEEYPTLKEELDENDERIYAVEHECNIFMTTGWNHDKQSVIDAWNRRA